jgi:hypothetical protein
MVVANAVDPAALDKPAWRPSLAPVEYGLAVAAAWALGRLLRDAWSITHVPTALRSSVPAGFMWAIAIRSLRDATLMGVSLGLLANRAEKRGKVPRMPLFLLTALAVLAVGFAARMVPLPWEPAQVPPWQSLGGRALALTALVSVLPVGLRAAGMSFALRSQGRWWEGLVLAAPMLLEASPTALGRSLVRLHEAPFVAAVAIALPILTHFVPRLARALGVHTRPEE